jgi:hypothetical protein
LSEYWLFCPLPVTSTGICFSCSTAASYGCHLFILHVRICSTPLRNRAPQLGIKFTITRLSSSVVSHVLISGNLSVLSSKMVIS